MNKDVKTTAELVASLQQESLSSDIDDEVKITIQRKSIYASTVRAINRPSFSFFKTVRVNFLGEDAVDGGGPRREFFRLLMKSLKELGIFEGLWFSHDISLLQEGKYSLAGKLIGWSILQGGPEPRCLSDEAFHLLIEKTYSCDIAITHVLDQQLRIILNDIKKCTSEDFADLVNKHGDHISGYGFSVIYLSKLKDKDDIITGLLRQYFIFRVHAEIEQFFSGLNHAAGVGSLVKSQPQIFASYLSAKVDPLNLSHFKKLCNVSWSLEGSNAKNKEDSTIYCWESYLQGKEENPGDIAINDVLAFITGADHIPPLGFPKSIDICFYDYEPNCKRLPWTSTCAL